MIGTEVLDKILISALYTAYIADEKPLSLMVTAKVESGKTELMSRFKDNDKIKFLTDATAFSIWRDLSGEIEAGEVKHMMFPDLLTPLAKGQDTVNSFIMFLTNLCEEGLSEVHSGFLQEGGLKLSAPTPVGIIGGIPQDELQDQRHKWARAGFMSRMLPMSWSYSQRIIDEIKKSITERQYVHDLPVKLVFPTPTRVALPLPIAQEILQMESVMRATMAAKANYTYGFRLLKQLQRLIMGYALSQGRDYVTWSDLLVLKGEMFQYLNLEYRELP
jgi:hypothetical protein